MGDNLGLLGLYFFGLRSGLEVHVNPAQTALPLNGHTDLFEQLLAAFLHVVRKVR
jgi:hypothetical protein